MAEQPQVPAVPVLGGLIAYLQVDGAIKAAEFYKQGIRRRDCLRLSARREGPHDARPSPHQRHLADAVATPIRSTAIRTRSRRPSRCSCISGSDEIDAWWKRAVDAGCEVTMPLDVMFWGDRYGQLRDPFGVSWAMNAPVKKT